MLIIPGMSEKQLLCIGNKLGVDWKTLGGYLDIPLSRIKQLEDENAKNTRYAAWLLLVEWRDSHSGSIGDKKKILKSALQEINRRDVIELL